MRIFLRKIRSTVAASVYTNPENALARCAPSGKRDRHSAQTGFHADLETALPRFQKISGNQLHGA
jgi:hypothetical protein